jgi:hypothetical protein
VVKSVFPAKTAMTSIERPAMFQAGNDHFYRTKISLVSPVNMFLQRVDFS